MAEGHQTDRSSQLNSFEEALAFLMGLVISGLWQDLFGSSDYIDPSDER